MVTAVSLGCQLSGRTLLNGVLKLGCGPGFAWAAVCVLLAAGMDY